VKKIILIVFFALLIFSGCTFKEQETKNCCSYKFALSGECEYTTGEKVETESCDMEKMVCSVTFDDPSDPKAIYEYLPICTQIDDAGDGCLSSNCTTMICGQFIYEPFITTYRSSGTMDYDSLTSESTIKPEGLYLGKCIFNPLDYTLRYVLENTEGSAYVNTFRFGVGDSFAGYEKYKYYFPISDQYCGMSPETITGNTFSAPVDRYMNYLVSYNSKQQGEKLTATEVLEQFSADYCTMTGEWRESLSTIDYSEFSIFNIGPLPEWIILPYSSDMDNIKYYFYGVNSYVYSMNEIDSINPMNTESYFGIDKDFYSETLIDIYKDQMLNHLAPYECSYELSGQMCMSGNCNPDVLGYYRKVCSADEGQDGVACDCRIVHATPNGDGEMELSWIYDDININDYYHLYPHSYLGPEDKNAQYSKENPALSYVICDAKKTDGSEIPWEFVNYYYNSDLELTHHTYTIYNEDELAALPIVKTLFHKEIVFIEGENAGYAYINPDDFDQTYFAKTCNLKRCTDNTYIPGECDYTFKTDSGNKKEIVDYMAHFIENTNQYYNFAFFKPQPTNYYTALYEIKIHSLGDCDPISSDDLRPKVVEVGWCEPCSYATFAYQKDAQDLPSDVLDYYLTSYLKSDVIPIIDISNAEINAINPNTGKELQEQKIFVEQYASQLYQGPVVLITSKIDSDLIDSNFLENENEIKTMKETFKSAKQACPKCLVSLQLTFGENNEQVGKDRADIGNLVIKNLLNKDKSFFEDVDMIAIDFYPNEFARDGASKLCALSGEQKYELITKYLTDYANNILQKTGKPVVITNFGFLSASCFNPEKEAGTYLAYLFRSQKKLTKNGIVGLIYSDIELISDKQTSTYSPYSPVDYNPEDYLDSPFATEGSLDDFTQIFCDIQKSSKFLLNPSPQFFYNTIPLVEKTECVLCTDADYSANTLNEMKGCDLNSTTDEYSRMCKLQDCANKSCAIGVCTMPANAPTPKAGDPQTHYKCPENTLIKEECQLCSDLNFDFSCTITYANGTIRSNVLFNPKNILNAGGDLNLYKDYIASLYDNNGNRLVCCLDDGFGNTTTFLRLGADTKEAFPIVYSTTGNIYDDCTIYQDLSELEETFCGVELPHSLSGDKIVCTKVN